MENLTNLSALRSLCNAIANTFYPDEQTLRLALFNEGMDAVEDATPKDVRILRIAVRLVLGYVEGSRTENGVSTSVREDAVKNSIKAWCSEYGVDADEILSDSSLRTIENGTNLW